MRKLLRNRSVEVGWLFADSVDASFIWFEPERFSRGLPKPEAHRAVSRCPAVADLESRHFVIRCPYDITLRITREENEEDPFGGYRIENADGLRSSISKDILHLEPRSAWRHPDRPVIQVWAHYRFIADEPVYLSLLPPFLEPQDWPGVVVAGRFPIHIWPRVLSWSFEWYETSNDLVLRRGEPWMYIGFETERPQNHVRLVRARNTAELEEYCRGLDNVTHYVRNTFSLFDIARSRRPKRLLHPQK